ncbi:MAG: outer membrane beta-barrel protein [Hyphomicrobiaceae bacterium]|nr:outer membrane beta-barrel protein [Hyphomicrobiaceae bacterium]
MHIRLLLGAACTCLLVSPAPAADLGGPRKLPPATFNEPYAPSRPPLWQGLYWGLSGGYGWGDSDSSFDSAGLSGSASSDPEGYLASASVGYNYLLGPSFLVGVEGDLGFMDISADDKELAGGQIYRTSYGPWWGTMRGRAGIVMGPLLLYGTGGLAFASLEEHALELAGETASDREVRSGWVVGGGLEVAFSDSVSAKVEYLHMDFGSYDGITAAGQDFTFDNRVDVVRAGLNFRF